LREGEEKERRGEAAESAVEEQVVESEDGRVLTQGSHMEMGGGRRPETGKRWRPRCGLCSVFSFGAAGGGRKRVVWP
jgi:hypothetical protein